jgi:hypothetical protein
VYVTSLIEKFADDFDLGTLASIVDRSAYIGPGYY